MTAADWKEQLGRLAADLPAGEEQPEETAPEEAAPDKQTLHIDFERKGRGGKQATIISGFTWGDDEIRALLTRLQRSLGTGGSARGGEILLQGDRRQQAADFLRREGHRVK
ncbi:MAG: translation initiation factor [Clostridium sp.]|nr:translation initiation factor [Clostridium sp.]